LDFRVEKSGRPPSASGEEAGPSRSQDVDDVMSTGGIEFYVEPGMFFLIQLLNATSTLNS
jgi:hypothetical protein